MNKLFTQLRLRSGFHKLKRELKKRNRKNYSVSLEQAQNIGILVTINNQTELKEAEDLANALKTINKKVQLMGFLSNKMLKLKPSSNIQLLSAADVEWNYIPKKEKILHFVNNEFDILLNLCTEICFPLTYVTALSKSLFKVGAYNPKQALIFDFMLDSQQQSITGFSAELKYYLDKIK